MSEVPLKKSNAKVMVIGLDGVPASLLREYLKRGYMPKIRKILDSGYDLSRMDASVPDVSSTSWSSFMTGVNPGEHGIYGFMELQPGTYDLHLPNYGDVRAPALWDIIGQSCNGRSSTLSEKYKGSFSDPLRSVIMNIPQTYPAAPLNGVLTAGFVSPDLKKGTYPEACYDYLTSIGYIPDVDSTRALEDREAFLEEVFVALEKRALAFGHFCDSEEWDLFIGVVTETDRLHHFYFSDAIEPEHPLHDTFVSFYKKIDELVGTLYERFMVMTDGKGLFMTMSDHGFTEISHTVNLNAWLSRQGYLNKSESGQYFNRIGAGTKAFAMDPARIYLNLEGKYTRGFVKAQEKDALIEEIKKDLLALRSPEGKPVIKELHEGSRIYSGGSAGSAPELVAIAHDGFDLKATLQPDEVFGKGVFTGMHTRHDAHCIAPSGLLSRPVRSRGEAALHIEDLGDVILSRLTS